MRKTLALLSLAFLLTLGLAPAMAQDAGTTGTGGYVATEEDDADWGWLGLLGLVGLAGLSRRKHSEPAAYRDTAARSASAPATHR